MITGNPRFKYRVMILRASSDRGPNLAEVSQAERKGMIQKCIADIVIDREKSVAHFHVYRIPVLTPEIKNALKSSENEGTVMSCRSARNRVHT